MTHHRVLGIGALLLLSLFATQAQAARLDLQTASSVVEEGDLVEFLVYGTEFVDGTDGGDFAMSWTGNLTFVGLTIHDGPWDLSSFDQTQVADSYISYVDVFSSSETPGLGGANFNVATITLQATAVGNAIIGVSPSLVGWSLAGDTIDFFPSQALNFEIVPVPEPGTGTVLGLFSALLGGCNRRMRRSSRAHRRLIRIAGS